MDTIYFLQTFATPTLDSLALMLTNLGSEEAYIVMIMALFLGIDNRIGQRVGVFLLLSLFVSFHLKGLINTPRPYVLDPSVGRSAEAVATGTGPGFPSGHTMGTITLWGYLALSFKRPWFWVVAGVLMVVIPLTRIYLGVHVPIDIVGGVLFGGAILLLAYFGEALWLQAANWHKALKFGLGLGLPLVIGYLFPPPADEASLIMGAMAAIITAPVLIQHRTEGLAVWKRVVVALMGIVLVFAGLTVSSILLPEAIKRDFVGGFFRYFFVSYLGFVLTPYLARLMKLVPEQKAVTPQADTVAAA